MPARKRTGSTRSGAVKTKPKAATKSKSASPSRGSGTSVPNKTQPTGASVEAFLKAVPDANRRADALAVLALMRKVTGLAPRMWGPGIVGFGTYHYVYESGREGDMIRVGFSPRSSALTLYIMGGFPRYQALLARLGKHRTGKSCLYLTRLADVDLAVLEALIRASWAHMAERYPAS